MGKDGFFRALNGKGAAVVDRDGLTCAMCDMSGGVCSAIAGKCVRGGGLATVVAAQKSPHACSGSDLLGTHACEFRVPVLVDM